MTRGLGLAPEWLRVARALCLQNFNLHERALTEWLQAGHVQQAHSLWHSKILPLYMSRSAKVSMLKALQLGTKMTQAERQ